MTHSKQFNGPSFDSISNYYMSLCKCLKRENSYWNLKCLQGLCNKCCNKQVLQISNFNDEMISFNEFIVKSVPYLCKKIEGIKTKKLSKKMSKQFMMSC